MQRRNFLALAALPSLRGISPQGPLIPDGVVSQNQARVTPAGAIGEAAVYEEGHTDQLQHLSVGTWRVNPGKSPHNVHTHPEEELLVFIQGTGEISIKGKRSKVAPGSVMYCAGNLPHGVYNTGSEDMLFYFIKWKA